MSHDDFAFEPTPGIPAPLPKDEVLLWQGTPQWRSLALRAYHVRKVALYFAALLLWRVATGLTQAHRPRDIVVSCALLAFFGAIASGVLAMLAYFSSRSTVYSVTNRRVLLRHGIAVPMTMNVPFTAINTAEFKLFADGTGDIVLTTAANQRVGYLITWPHLKPGAFTRPRPALRALGDAQRAAEILSRALALDAGMTIPAPLAAPRPAPLPGGSRHVDPRPAAIA